jgi:ligand-binding sensor domain-containing protein
MYHWLLASIYHLACSYRWQLRLPRRLVESLVAASLVCLLFVPARAQRLVAPWQPDPVLSSLLVQQLLFSPAGYAWVATNAGVRRYDGYAAVPLAQLVQNEVTPPPGYGQLALDDAGTLWIGADAGLFRFVPRTGQLTRLALPEAPGEHPHVTALWYDARTRRLWVGYGPHQLGILDPAGPSP